MFVQNIIKLSAAVHELYRVQRKELRRIYSPSLPHGQRRSLLDLNVTEAYRHRQRERERSFNEWMCRLYVHCCRWSYYGCQI